MMTVVETIQPLGAGGGGANGPTTASALSSGVGAASSWDLFHSSTTPTSPSIYNDLIFIDKQPTTSLGSSPLLMTTSFPLLGSSFVTTSSSLLSSSSSSSSLAFPTTATMTTSYATSCAPLKPVDCSSSVTASLSTASTAPSSRALSSTATSASSLATGWTPDSLDDEEEEEDDDEDTKPKFRRATMGVEDPSRAADTLERCERRRSELRKTVSFSQISVREFQRTMAPENAPSTRRGLPLTLDWNFVDQESLTVDDYEAKRPKRRRNNELVMRTKKLMNLVLEFCSDMTEGDVLRRMKEAARAEKKMKQRQEEEGGGGGGGKEQVAKKAAQGSKAQERNEDEQQQQLQQQDNNSDEDGKTQVTEQSPKRFSKRFDKVIVLSSPPAPATAAASST